MKIETYLGSDGKNRYKFRIYIGIVKGKKKYIKRCGFKTKADARASLLSLQTELAKPKEEKIPTFKEVTDDWLKEYYETVQESTYIKTERLLKNHIVARLGKYRMDEINPLILQNEMNLWLKKLKNGRKNKGIISNIFKFAIRNGYVQYNPTESITTATRRRDENFSDFYNKEELKQFMELVYATEDLEKIAYFRLLAFTGARRGEIGALTWQDISNNTLTINKAVTRTYAGLEVGKTKTASSKRLVSLDSQTISDLKAFKKITDKKGLIFKSSTGGIMTDSLPRKWMHQILDGTDLRPIKIHGFRHTHASLCFEAGMTLKQVQYRLGHSDMKTTMNVYTHITKQAQDEIGEKFSNYINF